MNMETAPVRGKRQKPGAYLKQIAGWLNEPHRKRMGNDTYDQVIKAVDELVLDGRKN